MADFSTIACTEVHGTRVEGLSYKGGPTASVTLECAYADRFALRTDLLNNGYWPYSGGGYVPRVQSVSVTPEPTDYTQDGQAIAYKYAHLQVQYAMDESAGQNTGGGAGAGRQLYTETFEPQLEMISVGTRPYFFKSPTDTSPNRVYKMKEENQPTVRQYTFTIRRTYYNWISVPSTFATLTGSVNDAVVQFASLGLQFAAETLMFKPKSSQRAVSTDGTAGFTVSVDFIYRAFGWNVFPLIDPDSGVLAYREVFTKAPNSTTGAMETIRFIPYPQGDFSDWAF